MRSELGFLSNCLRVEAEGQGRDFKYFINFHLLGGWMVGWLDGWMVGWLDGWMVGWPDCCMVGKD